MAALGRPNYETREDTTEIIAYLWVMWTQDGNINLVTDQNWHIPYDRDAIKKINPNAKIIEVWDVDEQSRLASWMGKYMPEQVREDTRKIIEKFLATPGKVELTSV